MVLLLGNNAIKIRTGNTAAAIGEHWDADSRRTRRLADKHPHESGVRSLETSKEDMV